MKKLIALLLALVMVLSMAACGGKTDEPTDAPTTEPAPTETPAKEEGDKIGMKVFFGIEGNMAQLPGDLQPLLQPQLGAAVIPEKALLSPLTAEPAPEVATPGDLKMYQFQLVIHHFDQSKRILNTL